MNYKYFYYLLFIFIISCEQHESKIVFKEENNKVQKIKDLKKNEEVKKITNNYSTKLKILNNKGLALIFTNKLFEDKIISNKIKDNTLVIFNKDLEDNTPIKITNLINKKFLISKTSSKLDYPFFYNSVISQR